MTSIFAIQDQIASAVAQALKVKLLPVPGRWPTRNAEAYDLYLQGHDLALKGTPESARRAIGILEKALSIDGSFALAQAQLVICLGNVAITSAGDDGPEMARRALEAADRAVALGPDLALAFAARGWARATFRWERTEGLADAERAVSMRPNDIIVHDTYAVVLSRFGRLDEAIAEARRGNDLDPLDAVGWANLGSFLTEAGQFDLARKAFARAAEISPDLGLGSDVGTLELLERRPAEALAAFEGEARERFRLSGMAMALHDLGRESESRSVLDVLAKGAGLRAPYVMAQAYAHRGELERAFDWLDRAYRQRDLDLRFVKSDRLLQPLSKDARYKTLLQKMDLPAD